MSAINSKNFHHYLLAPWSSDLNTKEKYVCWGTTLSLGVLFAGLPQLGCAIAWGVEEGVRAGNRHWKNRKIAKQELEQHDDNVQSVVSEAIHIPIKADKQATKELIEYLESPYPPLARNVHTWIEQGADVNCKIKLIKTYQPLLMKVISSFVGEDRLQLVQLLLEKGVNPNLVCNIGTPLGYAISYIGRDTSATLIRLLLEHGADPNLKWKENSTPLMHLLWQDPLAERNETLFLEMIQLLLEAGANVNVKFEGWTPLHKATDLYPPHVGKLLIEYGAEKTPRPPAYQLGETDCLQSVHGWLPLYFVKNYPHIATCLSQDISCYSDDCSDMHEIFDQTAWTCSPKNHDFAFILTSGSKGESTLVHCSLIYVDHNARTIEYYDSMRTQNSESVNPFLKRLAIELGGKDAPYQVEHKVKKTLQHNSFQCHVWSQLFLMLRLENPDFDVNSLKASDAVKMRKKIRSILLKIEKADRKQRKIFLKAYGMNYKEELEKAQNEIYANSDLHPRFAHFRDMVDRKFLIPDEESSDSEMNE